MTAPMCSVCGDETPFPLMQPNTTHCKDCHQYYDMDRHQEIDPSKIADAQVVTKLLSGKIGVECPHRGCRHKIMRSQSYFHRDPQLERCPKCMKHYFVRKGKAVENKR